MSHPSPDTPARPGVPLSARSAGPCILTLTALGCLAGVQPALAAQPTSTSPPAPSPTGLQPCNSGMLPGHAPNAEELAAHRKQAVPSIRYPFGSHPAGGWGLFLTLQINEAGQVVCYRMKDQYGKDMPLNEQRHAVLEQVKQWRYAPFMLDQHAVPAVLVEHIGEEELPQAHVATPEGPAESVHIRLDRSGCSGVCPVYSVEISGDGQALYRGGNFVDVQGEHKYSVPPADAARLIQKLRAADLWSLRTQYIANLPGAPEDAITIRIGKAQRQLVDHVGEQVGMPQAVADFEDEIDRAAHAEMFISLNKAGLDQLKKENFDFHSKAAGDLLARAITGVRDEAVLLEMVNLGAPLGTPLDPDDRLPFERSLTFLDQALLNGQPALAEALISHGALQVGGKLDPHRLDVAFRAAITGGRLAAVQKIWDAGQGKRPSLTYVEPPQQSGRGAGKTLPVTLLLSPDRSTTTANAHAWEGLAITKWLEAQGCDLKAATADGITLLHVAVSASDLDMVRYLLSRGLKESTTANSAPLLQSAHDEQTALLLLTSGTSQPPAGEAGRQYRAYVEAQHWSHVGAWLKAHGG